MTAKLATPVARAPAGRVLQRKCACGTGASCEACGKKKELQRKATGPTVGEVPDVVFDLLRSPGQPLDAATRAYMEPRFGHDFSRVRVHTDARAAASAAAVNADAYTVGQQIVFGAETRNRSTGDGGLRLLSHELAHTIQQGRATSTTGELTVAEPHTPLEAQADRAANAVASNAPVPGVGGRSEPAVQRSLFGSILGGVAGAALGAVAGGLIGGPIGAIAVGLLGGFIGAKLGDTLTTLNGVTTVDCDQDPTAVPKITAAHARATAMLQVAIQKLSVNAVTRTDQVHFENHFGPFSSMKRDIVVRVLQGALNRFRKPSMRYECETNCGRAWTLFVGNVHLCPNWFADQDIDSQAETLIHENLHHDALLLDLGYHQNATAADQSFFVAMLNADAYSEMVEDLN